MNRHTHKIIKIFKVSLRKREKVKSLRDFNLKNNNFNNLKHSF